MHSCQGSAIFSRERTAKRNCRGRGLGSSGGNGLVPTGSPAPESLRAGPGRLETPPSRLDSARSCQLGRPWHCQGLVWLKLVYSGILLHSLSSLRTPFLFLQISTFVFISSLSYLPRQEFSTLSHSVALGWLLKSLILISRLYFRSSQVTSVCHHIRQQLCSCMLKHKCSNNFRKILFIV